MSEIVVAIITAIISPTLLFVFQLIRERKQNIAQQLASLDTRIRRVEILSNISNHPEDAETILGLFDEYSKAGGNSYIQSRIEEWKATRKKAWDKKVGRRP